MQGWDSLWVMVRPEGTAVGKGVLKYCYNNRSRHCGRGAEATQ